MLGSRGIAPLILYPALAGGKRSVSRLDRFVPQGKRLNRRLGGPRDGVDVWEKKTSLSAAGIRT
jgi:hypothetical protein